MQGSKIQENIARAKKQTFETKLHRIKEFNADEQITMSHVIKRLSLSITIHKNKFIVLIHRSNA